MRNLTLFFLWLVIMPASIRAAEPIVFVSAFAAGAEGAIHAYGFDSQSGRLKLLQRTTDVEHPFFLALSPDAHTGALHATAEPISISMPACIRWLE